MRSRVNAFSTLSSNFDSCDPLRVSSRAISAAMGCDMNSWLLTWYFTPRGPVVRSVLYRVDGVNVNRGSGVGGVLRMLGNAERSENRNNISMGASCIRSPRVPPAPCCCCCCCCPWPVRLRVPPVVKVIPGPPNVAVNTRQR